MLQNASIISCWRTLGDFFLLTERAMDLASIHEDALPGLKGLLSSACYGMLLSTVRTTEMKWGHWSGEVGTGSDPVMPEVESG